MSPEKVLYKGVRLQKHVAAVRQEWTFKVLPKSLSTGLLEKTRNWNMNITPLLLTGGDKTLFPPTQALQKIRLTVAEREGDDVRVLVSGSMTRVVGAGGGLCDAGNTQSEKHFPNCHLCINGGGGEQNWMDRGDDRCRLTLEGCFVV